MNFRDLRNILLILPSDPWWYYRHALEIKNKFYSTKMGFSKLLSSGRSYESYG